MVVVTVPMAESASDGFRPIFFMRRLVGVDEFLAVLMPSVEKTDLY